MEINKEQIATDYLKLDLLTKTEYKRLKKKSQDRYNEFPFTEQPIIKSQYNKTSDLIYIYNDYDKIPAYYRGIQQDEYLPIYFSHKILYENYIKYIYQKNKDRLKLIRDVLHNRIVYNELTNIKENGDIQLTHLCVQTIIDLLKYNFAKQTILNVELKQLITKEYETINNMYKKNTGDIYNLEKTTKA